MSMTKVLYSVSLMLYVESKAYFAKVWIRITKICLAKSKIRSYLYLGGLLRIRNIFFFSVLWKIDFGRILWLTNERPYKHDFSGFYSQENYISSNTCCHIWRFIVNLPTFDPIWLPKFYLWLLGNFGYLTILATFRATFEKY